MHSNQQQIPSNFTKTKMICPPDIQHIYEAALSKKTKFVD